jgi:hypothetical protein
MPPISIDTAHGCIGQSGKQVMFSVPDSTMSSGLDLYPQW